MMPTALPFLALFSASAHPFTFSQCFGTPHSHSNSASAHPFTFPPCSGTPHSVQSLGTHPICSASAHPFSHPIN
ncbi:BQ5605_C002g01289 [Microbotryum silenes-dioicae]|uniref:BQ5605_C002g01289 protein n=1 Tax=Microbotryum silenes-dioicae TaxID=796604 RepID=A0A2X0P1H4_9BASI|nr:BQ5605_C002g01289 [Microbotryum silenes-dioicae]